MARPLIPAILALSLIVLASQGSATPRGKMTYRSEPKQYRNVLVIPQDDMEDEEEYPYTSESLFRSAPQPEGRKTVTSESKKNLGGKGFLDGMYASGYKMPYYVANKPTQQTQHLIHLPDGSTISVVANGNGNTQTGYHGNVPADNSNSLIASMFGNNALGQNYASAFQGYSPAQHPYAPSLPSTPAPLNFYQQTIGQRPYAPGYGNYGTYPVAPAPAPVPYAPNYQYVPPHYHVPYGPHLPNYYAPPKPPAYPPWHYHPKPPVRPHTHRPPVYPQNFEPWYAQYGGYRPYGGPGGQWPVKPYMYPRPGYGYRPPYVPPHHHHDHHDHDDHDDDDDDHHFHYHYYDQLQNSGHHHHRPTSYGQSSQYGQYGQYGPYDHYPYDYHYPHDYKQKSQNKVGLKEMVSAAVSSNDPEEPVDAVDEEKVNKVTSR